MFNNKKSRGVKIPSQITTMYKMLNKKSKSQIKNIPTIAGESIEEMLRRITANKEPIPQNVGEIFTPKEEGVKPEYDIRADRFEIALKAKDKFEASKLAKAQQEATQSKEIKEPDKNE